MSHREKSAEAVSAEIHHSANFMQASLSKLANNVPKDEFYNLERLMGKDPILKQKGVCPYEHIDSLEKLNETCLPPKEKFYSSLTNEHITDEHYARAQEVWNKFDCKTMWDYERLYLIT
jgi:hypothetical protein